MPTERVVDLNGFPNIVAMDLFATPTQKRLVSAKLRVIESSGVSKKDASTGLSTPVWDSFSINADVRLVESVLKEGLRTMLDIIGSHQSVCCNGSTRRDFLKVGALGMTGLTLSDLLRAQAAMGSTTKVPDKTVIWLFLSGGPSHYETFDPKPNNLLPYRSTVGTLQTNVPGTHIGGLFPRLAKLADKYSIIRSFAHTAADHTAATHWLSTGHDYPPAANGAPPISPSFGSMLSKYRGSNHPVTGMPTYVGLDHLYAEGPAWLGAVHSPFDARGNAQANMTPRISLDRVHDRKALRQTLDRFERHIDQSGAMLAMDEFEGRALELIRGNAHKAFDLSLEDPALLKRYGTGGKKLGENLLLARRLAEANTGFVTVWYGGWDSHGTNPSVNHGTIEQEMHKLAPEFDHAVSVFIEDLYDRGLDEKVLLAIVGEFGRSPHINKDGGREHWPQLGNQVLVGGGLKMGQIIGESTTKGDVPKSNPISPNDLLATLFQYMAMPLDLQYTSPAGRPTSMLETGTPLAELFS